MNQLLTITAAKDALRGINPDTHWAAYCTALSNLNRAQAAAAGVKL